MSQQYITQFPILDSVLFVYYTTFLINNMHKMTVIIS